MKIKLFIALFLISSISFASDFKFSVGPTAVMSSGLGYEPYYLGGIFRTNFEKRNFLVKSEIAAFSSHKTVSLEEGAGYYSLFSFGRKYNFGNKGNLEILIGAEGTRQVTDTWEKIGWFPLIESCWVTKRGTRIGFVFGGKDSNSEVQNSWYSKIEFPGKPSLLLTSGIINWEQVGRSGTGIRSSISILWPIGSNR